MFSYIASNVLSSGDFREEHVFYGLPETDRDTFGALMAELKRDGTRYAIVSRETRIDGSEDSETETSVIVAPSPQWLADMLRFIPWVDGVESRGDVTRYSTASTEHYEVCTCHYGNQHPVDESYAVDIAGISPVKLSVIESVGGVKR